MSHLFADFWLHTSRLPCARDAAMADNCRFDERTDAMRWQAFQKYLPLAAGAAFSLEDWAEAHTLHLQNRVQVLSSSTPDAFLEINRPAWLHHLNGEQMLVRLESLDWLLDDVWATDMAALEALLKQARQAPQSESAHALNSYMHDWNLLRDNRPSFAAFFDEVGEQAEHADWPHQLRDRLGLGHYSPLPGDKIPVALMRYPLQEALNAQAARSLSTACALPSVLDGGMHEYYFPAPAGHPFGATLHLIPSQAACLSAEILHCRIDYQAKHLYKLGWIVRPHALDRAHPDSDTDLRTARDLHLLQLRIDCERDAFGEEMAGRT